MIRIGYSGRSQPSAERIAEEGDFELVRSNGCTINWGRSRTNAVLNPDISNSTNKRIMRQLFAQNDVPMPRMVDVQDIIGFDYYFNKPFKIVGRPDHHTKGRGFWLCQSILDIQRAIRGTHKKKAATHFMEYIDAPHEYRVHIFLGKSIRISEKKFDEDHSYTTIKPTGNVKHVRKAAKKAVEALGLDFGAVDILATDDECWVLEVNAAPGLGGTMPALYAETFLAWENGDFDEQD
jgi:glutathione synthase/RimK-type ligase-like ATP-grasp enzyme